MLSRTDGAIRQKNYRIRKGQKRFRPGRPKKHATPAARQKAYRLRHAEAQVLDAIFGPGREQAPTDDHQRMLHNTQVLHAGSETQELGTGNQGF